jgi:hypothetical protein
MAPGLVENIVADRSVAEKVYNKDKLQSTESKEAFAQGESQWRLYRCSHTADFSILSRRWLSAR